MAELQWPDFNRVLPPSRLHQLLFLILICRASTRDSKESFVPILVDVLHGKSDQSKGNERPVESFSLQLIVLDATGFGFFEPVFRVSNCSADISQGEAVGPQPTLWSVVQTGVNDTGNCARERHKWCKQLSFSSDSAYDRPSQISN